MYLNIHKLIRDVEKEQDQNRIEIIIMLLTITIIAKRLPPYGTAIRRFDSGGQVIKKASVCTIVPIEN